MEPECGRTNIMDVINKGEIYLTFVFDDIDSTQIGIASVTSGGGYSTPILPSFKDNSLEVDGYNGTYYFNTGIPLKSFTYNCFIDNMSQFEFDQLRAWIAPGKIAKLIRPEEPYRYYWAKISSIENLDNIPLTHPDTGGVSYTGSFSITFTTVGQSCGYGMVYSQEDIDNYEYKDIFTEPAKVYYDGGLLYKNEMPRTIIPTNIGTYNLRLYNPGTFNSKVKAIITAQSDITYAKLTIENLTTGDVSIITLEGISNGSKLVLDWDKNEYTLEEENYVKNVEGDIIYLSGRDFIEKNKTAQIKEIDDKVYVLFDRLEREVKTSDINKTVMVKDEAAGYAQYGWVKAIDKEKNAFILAGYSGQATSEPQSVVITITKLDDIEYEIESEELSVPMTIEWKIMPRYL